MTSNNRTQSVDRGVRLLQPNGHQIRPIAPAVKQQHAQEQEVLSGLNERMKNYVERVLFLEETNKKLLNELDKLRNSWGQETKFIIEEMEPKLQDKRDKIDELSRDASKSGVKAKRLEYEIGMMKSNLDEENNHAADDRDKIKNLQHILEQNTQEIKLLEERISEREIDNKKHAKENAGLNDDLSSLLNDLDEENFRCLNLDNENQTLREQIKFLQDIHEQEIKEMRNLSENTKKDPASYYRSELEKAIRDIKKDFEQLNENERRDLEAWYQAKSDELRALANKNKHDPNDELPSILAANKPLKELLNKNNDEIKDLDLDNKMLEKKLHDLEQLYDNLKRDNFLKLNELDKEIEKLKKSIKDYLNDYDHVLHNKCDVELEINTLRRIMDTSHVPEAPKKPIEHAITRDDLLIRLEREKAKTGDFHVSIAWDNMNDLDLHVIEPSGEEISFSHRKSATGGELDVDMNAGSQRNDKPVENIYWPKGGAPHGHYKILIVYYSNHGGNDPTNYLCLTEMFGKQFEFRGKMTYGDKPNVFDIDV